jgi:PKD repeat protein
MNYKLNIKGIQLHKLLVYSLLISSVLISSCKKDEPTPADTTTPTAGFMFTSAGLIVTFTNTSTDANTYSWDFGDSDSSTDASPSHEYSAAGAYTVILTATRTANGKTNTDTQTVTVAVVPVASFTTTIVDLMVTFQNTSTNASTYAWKFGDGSTSTDKDPVHTYANNGTFTVELVATGDGGNNTVSQEIAVVAKAAIASFTSANNDLEVTFTNTSTDATAYLWDFGDGSATSSEQSPVHTYASGGTYDVSLTVSGDNPEPNTNTQSITVIAKAAVASFTSVANALEVTFTNTSTDATTYLWNFGDGSATSTVESPTHTYAVTGTYDVSLTVSGANPAENTATEPLSVAGNVNADFTFSSAPGFTINFTNQSTDALSYLWDFGDGSTSIEVSPSHSYASAGTYIIKLVATGVNATTDEKFTEQTVN